MSGQPRTIGTGTLALLVGLLFALGPVTVDMSLPSLPAVQQALGNGGLRVELTLTLLFFGMALTQLVYGAVADRYGRRLPLLLGLALYAGASLLAAFATGIAGMAVARVVQAVGYGVVIVLVRSAVTDVCDERGTARVYSIAITLMSVMSVIAPAIGGQVLARLGWRAIFMVMAGLGLIALLLSAWWLPETQPRERRSTVRFGAILGTYGALLRNGRFAALSLVAAGAVACQFSYNVGGPAVLIEHFGLSPATAGLLLSLIALGTAVAAQANVLVLRRATPGRVMLAALYALVAAALALLLAFLSGLGGVVAVVVILFVLVATPGFIVTNAMAGAISSAGDRAGAASALVGVMQFMLGTAGSGIVGSFHDPSGRVLGVVILVLGLVALGTALRASRSLSAPPAASP